MRRLLGKPLSPDANIRRIRMLYGRLPSGLVSALIGVFLCFVVLLDSVSLNLIKAWSVYMVSIIAARSWIWYMFANADLDASSIRRWEWLFAAGALLTGLGWGALFGPMHPPATHPEARIMIVLLVIVVSFAGGVFLSLSNLSFWLFVTAALGPALVHFTNTLGRQLQWPVAAAISCIVVLVLLQRTLHHSESINLERGTEAKALLDEQHAIFDSSPLGIAMIEDKRIVKCNVRLAELLGRRIQDLSGSTLQLQFFSPSEAEQFFADARTAFDKGRLAQGMYRLRRADGTQFWAELSGRRMTGGSQHSVWTIADVTLRVANERRAHPRPAIPDATAKVAVPPAPTSGSGSGQA
ncbi:MAG: PAS domain S-box protein [Rhodocyclales bacterium]|nr:PAS domain S-box protein [Rhodocyclales bacterium]